MSSKTKALNPGVQQTSKNSKRFTSIARKINGKNALLLFRKYLSTDLFTIILICILFVVINDINHLGSFDYSLVRGLRNTSGFETIIYSVGTTGSPGYYELLIGPWLIPIFYGICIIFVVQFFDFLTVLIFGTGRIRKALRPLNDIALQTTALTEMALDDSKYQAFDDSKYQNLEEAISNFSVEKPGSKISMKDKELQGIETAINDLIERMRNNYRQQTRFVSDASHELRTPIAVIQGYVNMLDRWGKTDEAILDESIEAIKNEAGHMQKLVEQLLFLARGDSNRQALDIKEQSLNEIMREVYEESIMIDEHHRYVFEERGEAHMMGDNDMLKQSARILIDNAVKYTPEGEEIIIRAGIWTDDNPFYQIQDNGIGMKREDLEHVFERFYRADAVRNSKTGGTGLGLSIAKWIIDQHNGYYAITSREQIGTRFTAVFRKDESQKKEADNVSKE